MQLRSIAIIAPILLVTSGCDRQSIDVSKWTSRKPDPSHVTLKRVPLKLKFGPIGAALEVDLSELKNIALDAKEILGQVVLGVPGSNPPATKSPLLMVVNKRNNKFTYFEMTSNVQEVRLKAENSNTVELIVRNKEPLQIELWVDSASDVDLAVEFK